jgi:hypothetical protein
VLVVALAAGSPSASSALDAPAAAAESGARDASAAGAEAGPEAAEIVWSARPGCFERHLQRRHRNPLFPPERRRVSAAELEEARRRDASELESLRRQVSELLDRIARLSADAAPEELRPVQRGIQTLFRRSTEVGGKAIGLAWELRNLHQTLADLWPQAADRAVAAAAPESLEPDHSFLSQALRADSPIRPDELVPSLLSEDVGTIRSVARGLDAGTREMYRLAARALVESVRAGGDAIAGLDEKLRALETDPE